MFRSGLGEKQPDFMSTNNSCNVREVPLQRGGKRGVSLSVKTGVDPAKKGPGAVHFSMGGLRKWYFSAINLLGPQISPRVR